jgi:D-alanyl-lipoteichoic acid acyltransferase DltB (MBOAT superfamily)
MLFNTWGFAAFFAVFFAAYLPLKKTRFRELWLLIGSYGFYAWWSPYFLVLLLFCTSVDYLAVLAMARSSRRKLWLVVGVACNLSILGFYKYSSFAVQNINWLLEYMRLDARVSDPHVALPLGISFFIFQSMSYTIDHYRGKIEKETDFIRYAAFVAFFPKVVMGPIERYGNLRPQLEREPEVTPGGVADGLSIFTVGLFKKVILADSIGLYVDAAYNNLPAASGAQLLLATLGFGWQLYFDFSGYTDMARGIARVLGFDLILNFNNPYLATGLGDFWRRWHIGLSTWFRDYVYIPLGGNRHGEFRTLRNLFLTMVISGLWHGAAWTFVIWGALHGLGYVLTRGLERAAFYRDRVPRLVKQLWVYLFVNFAWIFFRAASLAEALTVVGKIFGGVLTDPRFPLLFLALIAAIWAYQFVFESRYQRALRSRAVNVLLMVLLILVLLFYSTTSGVQFIYVAF